MFTNSRRSKSIQTMDVDPQGFIDNMSVAFDDFSKYHNSMSAHKMDVETTSNMINEFNLTFPDANIPQIDIYRPDLDLSDAERREGEKFAYDNTNPRLAAQHQDLPFKQKKEFAQKKISNYLSNIPPSARDKYKGYDYFFEKEAELTRDALIKFLTDDDNVFWTISKLKASVEIENLKTSGPLLAKCVTTTHNVVTPTALTSQ